MNAPVWPAKLSGIRDAQVAAISAALPALKTVEKHRGRFDSTSEIRRYATRAPAVLVADSGFRAAPSAGGQRRFAITFAWFVITRDAPGLPRDVSCEGISEALTGLVDENTWGLDYLGAPEEVSARNLYAGAIDQLGVGLWGMTFRQFAVLDVLAAADYQALNKFLVFHQDVDMAPADDQIDISETDDLPQ